MKNFKHILVPVDLTDESRQAMHYGMDLAKESQATLHLLTVVQAPVTPSYVPPLAGYGVVAEGVTDAMQSHLTELVAEIEGRGITLKKSLLYGDAAEQILAYAAAEHIELIVMGTHNRSSLERMLLGSTTEAVVRNAACPVLTLTPKVTIG